ncbi:MAG TPA: lamin tail domain-containing protein [Verrucomicrobiota bacterium]|nr:lamin tail domain-containing protein [Verrucomicrobiota bacterium]HNU51796.1 lamin tail domain-containing protein [Verrucomicrobiota bacterium]
MAALIARGEVIPGLFATGVDGSGGLLSAGSVDPHYTLIASPDAGAPGPDAYVVQPGFPIPPWAANGPRSQWIGPQADQSTGSAPGDYVYRLVFNLDGLVPETASIEGQWSSDNVGPDIRLNGVSTGQPNDGNFGVFGRSFRLTSGFVAGVNTLDFVVNNAGTGVNPTGLRVELAGTAEVLSGEMPPRIVRPPESVLAEYGESVRLVVSAYGTPVLRYEWRRNGVVVAGATNAVLAIARVTAAEAGDYVVTVSNALGSTSSPPARVALRFERPGELSREPLGPSSRRTGLVISEIMYHPADREDGRNLEYIEIHNTNPFFEDLSGWRLTGEWDYVFPESTVLPGNGFLVVAASPADVEAVYGLTGVLGGVAGRLANDGGTLRVRKRSGAIVLEVRYSDDPPWPASADGGGHSLVLARPSYGEGGARAWAASGLRGGSPGEAEPAEAYGATPIVINEVLAHSDPGGSDAIELFNAGLWSVDLSGAILTDDPSTNRYRIPPGTRLDPGAFAVYGEDELGFGLRAEGETLYLIRADEGQVLDAVVYGGQGPGVSVGRHPDGQSGFRALGAVTLGGRNARPLTPDVVISEILYHPILGDGGDEFVEIWNRSGMVQDVGGWRLTGGIEYTMPAPTVLPAGGGVVVARSAARLKAVHPGLAVAVVLGDFEGGLADGGERVALMRPEERVVFDAGTGQWRTNRFEVLVDEVTYGEGGQWGDWADGGGSSLERVDLRSDPEAASSWADSDETAKAPWTTIECTGVLDLVHPGVERADQLQILLLGAGEALVDDVEVLVDGVNRVSNSKFGAGVSSWTFQGTHRLSRWDSQQGYQGKGCLRLVASERGDHVANRVRTPLNPTIPPGKTATLRARVRWLRGHPEVLLRLRNGGLEASGRLDVPAGCGTPGAVNSQARSNAGPAITHVGHRPVLPAANQSFRVQARVDDPDGVGFVTLVYRLDPQTSLRSTAMHDDGVNGDLLAGDGVFTAEVPGQAAGTLVAFQVVAQDTSSEVAVARYPRGAPVRECLVRVGETAVGGAFGCYRIWLTQEAHDRWASREKMSNEDVDATFVYGANRVVYGAGARYSGSAYSAPGYTSPTGSLCGYDVSLPADDGFLGARHVTLDWPIRDATNQREQLMFWFLDQYDLPNLYRRYVHLLVNGVRRGVIYDDVQQPGADTIEEWFPNDAGGHLYKTDCWNEFDDAGYRIEPCLLNTLELFTTTGGVKKTARYRWNWRPRAVEGSADDFLPLFELVDAVNATEDYGPRVEAAVDIGHWMRTFAMNDLASFWDAFGNPNAKNTFLYKPERDTWKLMSWDFDVGLGVFNDPTDMALFDVGDPTIRRLYDTPSFVRHYWGALDEAVHGFFQASAVAPILDAKYAAFVADGIALAGPDEIESWITARRGFLLSQLQTVRSGFVVISNGGRDFTTGQNRVLLSGIAPVRVQTLAVNGMAHPVRWTTVSNWLINVALEPGTNTLVIEGWDRLGRVVEGAAHSLRIQYSGSIPANGLRINEWMAANRGSVVDPADGARDDWFELFNAGTAPLVLDGYSITDDPAEPRRFVIPAGFTLPSGGHLMVWADSQPEQTVAGVSLHANFRLDREGETLVLYDAAGGWVDAVEFGVQEEDVSEGRWPDGAGEPFFAMHTPTPGAPNHLEPWEQPQLRIVETERQSDGAVRLVWTALPGRTYVVQYRDELGSGSWADLEPQVTAEDQTVTWVDTSGAAVSRRYYRVMLMTDGGI